MGSAIKHGPLWDTHAEDWTYLAEPSTTPLWHAMLDATGVKTSTRLLDIGCGGGGLACLAVDRGADVSGIDASPALVSISRSRVPTGHFDVGDFESLPFESKAFDVVIACNTLQFVNDRQAALAEACRVLRPGGRFALGMWVEPERNQLRIFMRAIQDLMPSPPASSNEPPSLSALEVLLSTIESGGFRVESQREVECVSIYRNADDAWKAFRSAGLMVQVAEAIGNDKFESVVRDAIKQVEAPDGSIRLSNWFRYVVATGLPRSPG